MRAWRRSGGLGAATSAVVTILNIVTDGSDQVQVVFSAVVSSFDHPEVITIAGDDLINVVSGLGTNVVVCDGPVTFSVGQAWTFTAAGAGLVFVPPGTIGNQGGVTV